MGYGMTITVLLVLVIAVVVLIWVASVRTKLTAINDDVINAVSQLGVHMASYTSALLSVLERVCAFFPTEGEQLKNTLVKGDRLIVGNSKAEDILMLESLYARTYSGISGLSKSNPELARDYEYCRLMEELAGISKMVEISLRIYNNAAEKLNSAINHFPEKLVVGMLGFTQKLIFNGECHN